MTVARVGTPPCVQRGPVSDLLTPLDTHGSYHTIPQTRSEGVQSRG